MILILKRYFLSGLDSREKFATLLSNLHMKDSEYYYKFTPDAQQSLVTAQQTLVFISVLKSQSLTHLHNKYVLFLENVYKVADASTHSAYIQSNLKYPFYMNGFLSNMLYLLYVLLQIWIHFLCR